MLAELENRLKERSRNPVTELKISSRCGDNILPIGVCVEIRVN